MEAERLGAEVALLNEKLGRGEFNPSKTKVRARATSMDFCLGLAETRRWVLQTSHPAAFDRAGPPPYRQPRGPSA